MSRFQNLVRLHFVLLVLMILNFASTQVFDIGINNNLALIAKVVLYLSGIFLFFVFLKPFKKIVLYFAVYVATPLVPAALYIWNGIFLAILSAVILAPIMPLQPEYSGDNFKVYAKFNGFLGRCCEYYVTEKALYIFEVRKGEFSFDEDVDFQKSQISLEGNSIRIEANSVYQIELNQ